MTDYTMTVEQPQFTMSLSRTGGQGSKGDSVTNAQVISGEIIFTITRSDGTSYDVNAGAISETLALTDMTDVEITAITDGDIISYDVTTSKFTNHQLTTTNISDIDNTGKEDGAVLVYDNTAQKYQATNRIEKETTHIIGGSF